MINYFLSNKFAYTLLLFCLFILCILSYKDIIFSYPAYIHAWAQGDRYALALCFIENGFDFFHPCTFNYNLQFPSTIPIATNEGITSVDFPLVEYLIALIMKICGSTSPVIFRSFILSISLTGLFFLYKLCKMLIQSTFASIAICLFVFLSPIFNYYQIGFLPSISSLSCLFIAFYFYTKNLNDNANSSFIIAICFFTLAALFRFPFIIFFLSVAALHFLQLVKYRSFEWKKSIPFACAFICIGCYFLYNMHLRHTYGSIFLGHSMPAHNWDEFVSLLSLAIQHWGLHYFTFYQYVFIGIIALSFLMTITFSNISAATKYGLQILFIAFIGCSMYAVLMMQQFPDHDYYFLDTFFPVIILLLVFLTAAVCQNIQKDFFKVVLSLCLYLLLILSYADFKAVQGERYLKGQWSKMEMNDRICFEGSDEFLDSIGIPRSAKMLVVGSNTTNMPFIFMKRKGYAQPDTNPDSIRKSFTKNIDYVVLQNDEMYNQILVQNSSLIKDLVKVSDNGRISIYKIAPNEHADLKRFIGFTETNIFKKIICSFENNKNETKLENIGDTSDICFSKPYAGRQTNDYGLTLELTEHDFPNIHSLQLLYTEIELRGTEDHQQLELILQVLDSTGTSIYFKGFPLNTVLKKNEWNKASLVFAVPSMREGKKARIFFWNAAKKTYYFDDFRLYIKN